MAKASDNPFPSLLLVEQASAPATPASGQARLYRGTDNKLYIVDDAGVATEVGATTGGSAVTRASATTSGAGDISTTSTTFVDVAGLSVSIPATAGQHLLCTVVCAAFTSAASKIVEVAIVVAGTVKITNLQVSSASSLATPLTVQWDHTVAAGDIVGGNVTVKVQHKADTAQTAYIINQSAVRRAHLSVVNLG